MLKKLWLDQSGAIVSAEIVLVATIVVIGMITGLTSMLDGVIEELADVGAAVGNVDQSFSMGPVCSHSAATVASFFINVAGFCEGQQGIVNTRCLVINGGRFAWHIHGHDTGHQ